MWVIDQGRAGAGQMSRCGESPVCVCGCGRPELLGRAVGAV